VYFTFFLCLSTFALSSPPGVSSSISSTLSYNELACLIFQTTQSFQEPKMTSLESHVKAIIAQQLEVPVDEVYSLAGVECVTHRVAFNMIFF
jgi:hypothetical protein